MNVGNSTIVELQHAVSALRMDDRDRAGEHIRRAHALARRHARRERQLVEIAQCALGADAQRAGGLALEHRSDYPEDGELLDSMLERIDLS